MTYRTSPLPFPKTPWWRLLRAWLTGRLGHVMRCRARSNGAERAKESFARAFGDDALAYALEQLRRQK